MGRLLLDRDKGSHEALSCQSERIGFCVNQETVQSVIYRRAVDQRKKGRIRLIKIDKEEPERTLQGAEYELYKTKWINSRQVWINVLPEG